MADEVGSVSISPVGRTSKDFQSFEHPGPGTPSLDPHWAPPLGAAGALVRRLNTYIGAPVERVEDLRFITGRGEFIGDVNRPGQWHMVVLRSQIGHGVIRRDRRVAGAEVGRRARRSHRRRHGRPDPTDSVPPADPVDRALWPAGDRVPQGALRRRAGRGRAGRELRDRRGRAGADRPRHRAGASGRRAARRLHQRCRSVRRCARRQHHRDLRRQRRRRRGRHRAINLSAAAIIQDPAPDRAADGDARAARRVGRSSPAPDDLGRCQTSVLQPPRHGPGDGPRRKSGRLHRIRRRRRIWRARRVLSRGFGAGRDLRTQVQSPRSSGSRIAAST